MIDKDTLESYFGPNEEGILKHFVKNYSKEVFMTYLKLYRDYHAELLKDLFEGMRDLLKEIKDNNTKVILLTGRSLETTMISLTYLDAFKYFDSFYTGSKEKAVKDELLKEVMEDYKYNKEDILYIGDSLKDIEQCKLVDVDIISVSYDRPTNYETLVKANPLTVKSVEDLKEEIFKVI